MSNALLAVVRCDCGGRLQRGIEQTARGLRWAFACERCNSRWGHRDGVFGPLDQQPARQADESELLAWFRRLPGELRSEAISHVQALALSANDTS